jgi:hypothetical protein
MTYSDLDDYLVHQIPSTLDHVQDSDSHWTERFYFNCHARDGSTLLTTGYGILPNLRAAHGYAKLALADGRHWDVTAVRPQADRDDLSCGPMRWTIIEPRRRWRLELGPNPAEVEWDIEYEARAPLWELKPIFGRKQSRVIVNQQHIQQSGTYSGWVRAGGEEFRVDGFYGSRDRTWGIRNHAEIDMWIWFSAQFDDRAIAAWVWERKDGTVLYVDGGICHEDGTISKRFVRMLHEIEFDGGLKRQRSAVVTFVDEDGTEHRLKATAENPGVNVYYSMRFDPGRGAVQGEAWRADDDDSLRRVESMAGSSDQLMRYELDDMTGYGIFELYLWGDGYDRYAGNWPVHRRRAGGD